MQEFAIGKVPALGRALYQLTRFVFKNRQATRIIKLASILLLASCLQLSAKAITQTVSITVKDASLITVLKAIEKQTDYVFFVNNKQLQKAKKITVTANSLPLQQVLDLCFKDQPLTYIISGKVINIIPRQEAGKTSINMPESISNIDVKGRVVNESNDPIEGVNVSVKGTSTITSTNVNGEFYLKSVDENATLVFSSVNMEVFELKVKGRAFLDVSLQTKITAMQEVVINKGYYTETKRLSTGNVGKVTAKEIEQQPVQNPLLALQGRVPGISIIQSTGVAGGGVTVRIQGQNSIGSAVNNSTGNDPLYVIDGVPFTSQNLTTVSGGGVSPVLGKSNGLGGGAGNPLNYINPGDIESIEILKDADATSIYGSRAANGAILITTKKGKAGPMKVDVNLQQGWGKVDRYLDLLKTEDYLMMRREAFKNDNLAIPSIKLNPTNGDYDVNGLWDTTRYTDWQKTLIGGVARYQSAQLNVYGGTEQSQYLIGTSLNKTGNVFPGDFDDTRGSFHFNANSKSLNQRFAIQLSASYLFDKNELPANDFTRNVFLAPNAPDLYNSDGTLNWEVNPQGNSSWTNPLAYTNYTYDNKTTNLISNLNLSYKLTSSLQFKVSAGYTSLQTRELTAIPRSAISPEARLNFSGQANYSRNIINSWILEPQASYEKQINSSHFNILAGASIQQTKSEGESFSGSNYDNDLVLADIRAAATVSTGTTINTLYKYVGLFGRLNYTLKNRYIVNATIRRDGSSRFGPQSRFHNFGSIGLGWIFTDEKYFMEKHTALSFGKLRFSYGTTGNDQIGDYTFMNLYNTQAVDVPFQNLVGRLPGGLYNPYLEWEETKKLQVGIDFGFLKDRINLGVTYANNRSSNQLLGYSLPIMTGSTTIQSNFPATVQNTSWEFMLNSTIVSTAIFKWTNIINLTLPFNKLVSFPDLESSTYANSLIIGKPLGAIYTYQFLGVNPVTGRYVISDLHGNPTSTPNSLIDRTVLINQQPKYYGGVQNNLEFKNIQLSFLFQFNRQIGRDFLFQNGVGRFNAGANNQPSTVLSRWQEYGDNSNIERFSQNSFNGQRGNADYADLYYIKLRNVSLSYLLPKNITRRLHLYSGRFYVQSQNLLTITNYNGFDPETKSLINLPPLRVITFGAQFTF